LSYPLNHETTAYGGGRGLDVTPIKSISKGDPCNTSYWCLSNHLGTHLDFPKHFSDMGKTLDDYKPEFFIYKRVGFVDLVSVEEGRIIDFDDLCPAYLEEDIEILLVKTGFSKIRKSVAYWKKNPGFSPDLADCLRHAFPSLRVMGFDSISVSSYLNRELGREAHRKFLLHEKPILLLEDLDLLRVDKSCFIERLIVAPWLIKEADATPCTVMAEVRNER